MRELPILVLFYPFLGARVELHATGQKAAPSNPPADCPADVAIGLVKFHVGSQPASADCADTLADLLISAWEKRKGPKGGRRSNPAARRPIVAKMGNISL